MNFSDLAAQLVVGLINGSFYALMSLGVAIIFGTLRVANFVHGAQYMLGAFCAWILMNLPTLFPGMGLPSLGFWWALLLILFSNWIGLIPPVGRVEYFRAPTSDVNATIGMALVSPEGRWLQVNHALCEITGYSEREMLEITFQEITHPYDLDADGVPAPVRTVTGRPCARSPGRA